MVLGKLPVLGRPTNLDHRRARAYCAYSRCGWGLYGHFFSCLSFLSSLSFSQRAIKPKTTNQLKRIEKHTELQCEKSGPQLFKV